MSPTYLYVCKCGWRNEIVHGISEDLNIYCEECGRLVQRKPQLGAVTFKGEGWAGKEK